MCRGVCGFGGRGPNIVSDRPIKGAKVSSKVNWGFFVQSSGWLGLGRPGLGLGLGLEQGLESGVRVP